MFCTPSTEHGPLFETVSSQEHIVLIVLLSIGVFSIWDLRYCVPWVLHRVVVYRLLWTLDEFLPLSGDIASGWVSYLNHRCEDLTLHSDDSLLDLGCVM